MKIMCSAIRQKVGKNVNPDGGGKLKAFRAKGVVADNDKQSTANKALQREDDEQDTEGRGSSQWLRCRTGAEAKGQA